MISSLIIIKSNIIKNNCIKEKKKKKERILIPYHFNSDTDVYIIVIFNNVKWY